MIAMKQTAFDHRDYLDESRGLMTMCTAKTAARTARNHQYCRNPVTQRILTAAGGDQTISDTVEPATIAVPLLKRMRLDPAVLTATRWDDVAAKARMGHAILGFIAKGMPEAAFTKALYQRLSNMFSFIAHYDRHGFAAEYFTSTAGKVQFLEHITRHGGIGDPGWTWSDVECLIAGAVSECRLLNSYQTAARQEQMAREKARLAVLLARHGMPNVAASYEAPQHMQMPVPTGRVFSPVSPNPRPAASQLSLF